MLQEGKKHQVKSSMNTDSGAVTMAKYKGRINLIKFWQNMDRNPYDLPATELYLSLVYYNTYLKKAWNRGNTSIKAQQSRHVDHQNDSLRSIQIHSKICCFYFPVQPSYQV